MGQMIQDSGWRIPDDLWEQMVPLLPSRPSHPLGCHNPRVPDRAAMDAIFFVLRTGSQWGALSATGICSKSSAHRRFTEEAGVFHEFWRQGLLSYDGLVGIDWEWLWCINGVGDGFRPLCLCSGDLPGDRHAEAGHAVDHRAGDPGLDLLRGQSPGAEAPADQNLVPMESGFNQGPLPITDGFLPAYSAFPGEHRDVPVALSGLGVCGIAQNRV